MAWITGGATTLVERTRDITVLQERIESGNAIVYSNAGAQVLTMSGELVIVSVSALGSDLIEVSRSATLLVERAQTASTLQETA